MKTKYILLITTVALLATKAARADDATAPPPKLYLANQFDADLFGTYATRDRQGDSGDRFGGGAGVDYFFTRYLGIGADSYLEECKWPYRVNGSAILRIPIEQIGFTPYAFGGGGRQFKDVPQYSWHAGGGLEYRFCSYTGIFGDVRRVFPDKTPDYTLVRVGLRLAF